MVAITCVVDARAELGESTLWGPVAGALWWIEQAAKLRNQIRQHLEAMKTDAGM